MGMLNASELLNKYNHAGLPSFDVGGGNVDFIEAAFVAASRAKKGMYLSSTPSTVTNYLGYEGYVAVIKLIAQKYPGVDYAIHLDHAKELTSIDMALKAGYSSVMYDGSNLEFPENVTQTRKVVQRARDYGATVEAELGTIGGKEDELEGETQSLPTLEEIIDFMDSTEICLMAPAVGTVHGHFRGVPQLNWEVIEGLSKAEGNFVLHGCTGLDLDVIRRIACLGFVKFNFATALRESFQNGMLDYIKKHSKDIKPYAYLKAGRARLADYMTILFYALSNER